MPATDRIAINLQHVRKNFKTLTAVDDLSLQVEKGSVFGFLGPNGAGKSTTIRMILDLVRPAGGSIELFGLPLKSNRESILRRIGALVEKPDFYEYLSARRNLQILAKMIGGVGNNQVDEVLEIVDLRERADDKVKSYSHGMKQRLGIAQSLLGRPELIILDEPTTGLDPVGMKEVRELIRELARQNFTIFLSSHLLHEVEQVCTHTAIINKGKLIVQGQVKELLDAGSQKVTLEVDRIEEAAAKLSGLSFVKRVEIDGNRIKAEVACKDIPELNEFLVAQRIRVFRLQPHTSLEDFYLSLLEEQSV